MAKAKKTVEKASGTKPIADVAHPDTTAPSDTSKPIINQRPIMKDPMMVAADEDKAEEKKPLSVKTSETKIAPPEESTPEESAKEPADESAPEPAKEDTKPDSSEATEQPKEQSEPETDKKSSKPKIDAEETAKTAQDAKSQQLIESKKYFLPINAVEHRRSKRVVVIGIILALVLVVAWVDVALDASLIDVGGVKPVTHFFSN